MSNVSRLTALFLATSILGSCLSAEEAEQQVKLAFLHFDGESVVLELDGQTVFDKVLTTQDHSVGLSHVEFLNVKNDSKLKWTVDGREYEQQLEIDPSIGVVYITLGQPMAEMGRGDELLLD